MGALAVHDVCKTFGTTQVLDDVSFTMAAGEFMTLLGPSGCGKTTLLRIIAGLVAIDRGRVVLDGSDITGAEPHRRGIGMVFQSHALFPHMTVLRNVCFGLRMHGVDRRASVARAKEALKLVRLESYADRMPRELSGGQQQRVAIARAIAFEPRILLMDEPFGALDRKLRDTLQVELRRLVRELGITTVFVTHDQDEALVLSDRIALMHAGRIAQIGSPNEVFRRPRTKWVADFMGIENVLEAEVVGSDAGTVALAAGPVLLRARTDHPIATGQRVGVAIRAEDVRVGAPGSDAGANAVAGTVLDVIYRGHRWSVRVDTPVGTIMAAPAVAASGPPAAEIGSVVRLEWDEDAALVLAA